MTDTPVVELAAPDIAKYRDGGAGIPFVHTWDSGKPGRHVMISALTHGNEICGAIALVFLFCLNIRPSTGKLTFAFVNIDAHALFDPKSPYASRFVNEDFNRLWEEARLEGPDDTVELRRARELRPLFDTVDDLLDIHSMTSNSPPLVLVNALEKHVAMARRVAYPAYVVTGPVFAPGKRLIEYTPFDDPTNDKTALLVECGQHWAAASGVAAKETAVRFLAATGVLTAEAAAPLLAWPSLAPQQVLDVTDGVTAETDTFRFTQAYRGCEVFPKAGAVIATDGGREITTPYDDCALIMPNHRARAGQRVARLARRRA